MKRSTVEVIKRENARPDLRKGLAADFSRIDGIVIGRITSVTEQGVPRVDFPTNSSNRGITARTLAVISESDIGREAALSFEGGNPQNPIILGLIQHPHRELLPAQRPAIADRQVIEGSQEVELRCGAASIVLTRAGKVIIRGAYVISRSSGLNRLAGATVRIT